jgi:hypothetical protein
LFRRTPMDVTSLLPILAIGTLGAVIVFALISRYRTRQRKNDPNAPQSSLARDRPDPNFQPDATVTRKDIYPDAQTPLQQDTGSQQDTGLQQNTGPQPAAQPVQAQQPLRPASPARHPDGQHGFDDRGSKTS